MTAAEYRVSNLPSSPQLSRAASLTGLHIVASQSQQKQASCAIERVLECHRMMLSASLAALLL
jgi:hypothetical protein